MLHQGLLTQGGYFTCDDTDKGNTNWLALHVYCPFILAAISLQKNMQKELKTN